MARIAWLEFFSEAECLELVEQCKCAIKESIETDGAVKATISLSGGGESQSDQVVMDAMELLDVIRARLSKLNPTAYPPRKRQVRADFRNAL